MSKKGRYWACVGYPESLPINYIEVLQESGLQVAISPLHDRDVNPDNTYKKPHYHIILCYEGPTTYNNVKQLTDSLNMTIPIKLESIKGMYRYHLHLDNPEKFQYDDRDRILLNGFDPSIFELTKTEVNRLKGQLVDFIVDNDIVEYSDLICLLREENNLFDVATSHTIFFNTFLCSRRNKKNSCKK